MRQLLGRFVRRARRKRVDAHLFLSDAARQLIEHEARSSPNKETGGILMGYIDAPATVRVTHASGSGPGAYRSPREFLRDTEYCTEVLREHYERFGVDYVGEWHSHILPIAELTTGDVDTLVGIILDPDYDFAAFAKILVLVNPWRPAQVELRGYIVTRQGIMAVPLEEGWE